AAQRANRSAHWRPATSTTRKLWPAWTRTPAPSRAGTVTRWLIRDSSGLGGPACRLPPPIPYFTGGVYSRGADSPRGGSILPEESMKTVGFIGLGNMGAAMASNIRKAGYALVVHDVRIEATRRLVEAGARVATSPAEVARQAEVTLTSLPGPPEVEAVATAAGGLLEGMAPGGVWIDTSTSRPTLIRSLEPRFAARGIHVLDAPVSGGKSGAESRNLAVMVGGERAVFERVRPVLDAFGDKVFYAGAIGAGCVAKLVHNMIGHSVRQAVAE